MVPIPKTCDIDFPNQCMLKCRICHYWKNNEPVNSDEWLSVGQYRNFFKDIKEFAADEFEVSFGGGEPLIYHKTLFEITKICEQLSFKSYFPTNAYLIDEPMAKKIADSGVASIGISLDSLGQQVHDYIRGTAGTHNRAMQAIKYLKKYCPDLLVNILTVIMGLNINDILDLTKWVCADDYFEGIVFQVIQQPFNTDCPDNWYELDDFKELWAADNRVSDTVLDRIIAIKNTEEGFKKIGNPPQQLENFKHYFKNPTGFSAKSKCSLGNGVMRLNWNGDIMFCSEMEAIGNIKQDSIKKIWYSQKADKARQAIACCEKNCHNHVNCFQWYGPEEQEAIN